MHFACIGTLFSSMMFPDRAPNDQHLYTTFVGGSHNRDLAGAPTYKSCCHYLCSFCILARFSHDITYFFRTILKQLVTSDLKKLLGVEGQPTFVK
jgi:protoporphyrinogen/coproporphyrinogen III oxidase